MKVQTLSIVIGTRACNARCKGCVGKMTEVAASNSSADGDCLNTYRNLEKAFLFAKNSGVSTVLLTGKGEPTLSPTEVSIFTLKSQQAGFPFIELQTNGINLMNGKISDNGLKEWWGYGLNTICLSAVSIFQEDNIEYFGNAEYPNISYFVEKMHDFGFSVRLSILTVRGYFDGYETVEDTVAYCKRNNIEQLTFRNLSIPEISTTESKEIVKFCRANVISDVDMEETIRKIKSESVLLQKLMHGAEVRDMNGQNICITTGLSSPAPASDEIRQLIYTPRDGHLWYDWVYKGAILL